MTLDPYQMCPCGSGKKVKFCCSRDIIHELERVQRMIEGEQRLAALEKLESLLGKYPNRSSLLMLKSDVELALDENDKAEATAERLLEVDPQNPSVLALQATLQCIKAGDIHLAVEQLQRAFEAADSVITQRMYEAILLVSMRMLREGFPAAAKGHLQLAIEATNWKDERCVSMYVQLSQLRSIPTLLRESLFLSQCPENVTWKIEFQAAMQEVHRGRWLSGADKLTDMSRRILDAAPILQNIGVLRTWLAQNTEAVNAFRALSRIRELPLDERVHAEALAQLLDRDSDLVQVEVVKQTFHLSETDRLMERCLSHKCVRQLEVTPEDPERDEPPPKAFFDLLDRPWPAADKDLQVADLARSLAVMAVFGRQTDREARAEVILAKTHDFTACRRLLAELLDDDAPHPVSEEILNRAPRLEAELFNPWRLPSEIEPEQRAALVRELQQWTVQEYWPNLPSPWLGGKTPRETAQEGQSRVPLMATLLILETKAQDANWQLNTDSLREQLKLPKSGTIDASQVDLNRLPVHRFLRLNVSELTDEQLLTAYRRSYGQRFVPALRKLAHEVAHRPSLDEKIDKVEAYDILSDVAETTDEALEYLEKARKLATADGESPAHWLIDELELRLLRGEGDRFLQLLKEIQTRYMKEPGVSSALMEVLSRYGLVTPDGRLTIPTRQDREAAAATHTVQTAPAVWTPDTPAAPPPEVGEEKKESKLWFPNMD